MTAAEYWNNLHFDYLITYSLFRGEKYNQYVSTIENEIASKRQLASLSRWYQKEKLEAEIALLEKRKCIYGVTILDHDLKLHGCAEKVMQFYRQDKEVKALEDILTVKYNEGAVSACVPVYRDAIIFYNNKGDAVSNLNICFECWRMADGNDNQIMAYGEMVYPPLVELLSTWGHKI